MSLRVQPGPDIDWRRRLLLTAHGRPQGCSTNVRLILENDEHLRGSCSHCDFSQRVLRTRELPWRSQDAEWSERDILELRYWIAQRADYGIEPTQQAAEDGVTGASYSNAVHPVREYLESLEWDGQKRLSTWLYRYLDADDEGSWRLMGYLRAVGVWWLTGAVARVMQPGCKFDYMLILEGKQGVGKSTALRAIGGEWFTDSHLDLNSKDGNQFVQGIWIIEIAELDAFHRVEETRIKSFLAQQNDRFRMPFGKTVGQYARQCVFAGSTNKDAYLKDPTGSRRFWPVRCGDRLDIDGLRRDRDQLFAEAMAYYRSGRRYAPNRRWDPLFEEEQDKRFNPDAWQDAIEDYLAGTSRNWFTTFEIMGEALNLKERDMKPPEQTRVGIIMTKLGWQRKRVENPKPGAEGKRNRMRVYVRPDDKRGHE